ncbi:hypothetical protein ERO13_A08G021108v2 [Gossypium hirsutum]|nr:hypothetical protein ERO13_A08G021108v2 [Gossypium hirsutum]
MMGCICCKPSAIEDSKDSPIDRTSSKASLDVRVLRATSSRREEAYREKDQCDNDDVRTMLIDKQVNVSVLLHCQILDRKREKQEFIASQQPRIGTVPKATEGEQVAARWPAWLAVVAGEAIRGWIPRRADSFEKIDKPSKTSPFCKTPPRLKTTSFRGERDPTRPVPSGGSAHFDLMVYFRIGSLRFLTSVYRAPVLDQKKVVSLKKVRFDNHDQESVQFMAREIHILRRLDHPNVVKLEDLVTSRMSCSLYLVFEFMEYVLAGLALHSGLEFSESRVKCYMKQLLRGLDHCHGRGVLHWEGPNLLIDNNGILKIADFGLASFYDPNQSQPFTSRVVTLWYRPPELLLGPTCYGTAVDLWSTGCILAELYAGKPIMPGRTELCGSPSEDYWRKSKLPNASIFKPQQPYRPRVAEIFQEFTAPALALLETLLSVDPAGRGSAASALKSDFFTTEPLPCDLSSLPKYPPSKELDAKKRDNEARRQGAAGTKGQKLELDRRTTGESQAIPAPDADAELVSSMQVIRPILDSVLNITKSRSEKFNPHPEEVASGFPIGPSRPSQAVASNADADGNCQKRASHSGPLAHRAAWMNSGNNLDDAPKFSTAATDLSMMSSLVAARRSNLVSEDHKEKSQNHNVQQKEYGRSNNKDAVPLGYGSKGNKLHYSGPLLVPSSSNTDQFLKDHNRQIGEAVRRARLDKAKMKEVQLQEYDQISTKPLFVSGRGAEFCISR